MRQLVLIALVTASVASPAAGQDVTQVMIDSAVEKHIVPKLVDGGHTAVRLAPIVWADTNKPAAAGAGLSQLLADALTKHQIGLTVGARAVLSGTLARVTDEGSDPPAPALKLVLRLELDAKPACEVAVLILMEGTLRADPVPIAIPPKATPQERVEILKKARETTPPPQNGPVRWSPDGTVGLEMLLAKTEDVRQARQDKRAEGEVNKLFAPREPDAKGRVKTEAGESCHFRLTNKNSFAVAGELRVAGVDWSEFACTCEELKGADEKAQPKAKQRLLVVVPANASVVVRGYYRNESSSLTFDVRSLPATAAGRQTDVGVVAFQYAACWKQNEKPAPGEEGLTAQLSEPRIVPGAVQADKFETVERVLGKVRGLVKLEYGEFKE